MSLFDSDSDDDLFGTRTNPIGITRVDTRVGVLRSSVLPFRSSSMGPPPAVPPPPQLSSTPRALLQTAPHSPPLRNSGLREPQHTTVIYDVDSDGSVNSISDLNSLDSHILFPNPPPREATSRARDRHLNLARDIPLDLHSSDLRSSHPTIHSTDHNNIHNTILNNSENSIENRNRDRDRGRDDLDLDDDRYGDLNTVFPHTLASLSVPRDADLAIQTQQHQLRWNIASPTTPPTPPRVNSRRLFPITILSPSPRSSSLAPNTPPNGTPLHTQHHLAPPPRDDPPTPRLTSITGTSIVRQRRGLVQLPNRRLHSNSDTENNRNHSLTVSFMADQQRPLRRSDSLFSDEATPPPRRRIRGVESRYSSDSDSSTTNTIASISTNPPSSPTPHPHANRRRGFRDRFRTRPRIDPSVQRDITKMFPETLQKYVKMINVGVPKHCVIRKMKIEGISEAQVTMFQKWCANKNGGKISDLFSDLKDAKKWYEPSSFNNVDEAIGNLEHACQHKTNPFEINEAVQWYTQHMCKFRGAVLHKEKDLQKDLGNVDEKIAKLTKKRDKIKKERDELQLSLMTLKNKHGELRSHYKKRKKKFHSRWYHWTKEELLCWIDNVDNHKFKKYHSTLLKNFSQFNVNGSHLLTMDKNDLFEFGITNYGDRFHLLMAINFLKSRYPTPDIPVCRTPLQCETFERMKANTKLSTDSAESSAEVIIKITTTHTTDMSNECKKESDGDSTTIEINGSGRNSANDDSDSDDSSTEDEWERMIPNEFLCPIGKEIMKNPVIASDGYTYDRTNIEKWFCESRYGLKSPITNLKLDNRSLLPNRCLRILIRQFCENSNLSHLLK